MRTKGKLYLGVLMASLLATVGLVACGDSDDTTGTGTGASDGGDQLVGLINGGTDEFYGCLADGLKDGLDGKAEVVELNSEENVATEVSNGEDLLARDPDVIVLQTVNFKSGSTIVSQANRQDVPVVLSSVDFLQDPSAISGAVVYNLVQAGEDIGKHFVDEVGGPAKVGIVAGAPGAASDLLVQGFENAVRGTGIEIVADQPGMWSRAVAATVAENMIQANPNLEYVFTLNEDMAFGVLRSLQAANLDGEVGIITSGGTEEGLEAVEDGTFLSTTVVSPYNIGHLSAEATLEILEGKTPQPKVEQVGYPVITKDNIDTAIPFCEPASS